MGTAGETEAAAAAFRRSVNEDIGGGGGLTETMKLEDDFKGYDVDEFSIPERYKQSLLSVLITHGMVVDRTAALAKMANDYFGDQDVVVLGVLNGCFRFYSVFVDQLNKLRKDFRNSVFYEFVRLKSYVDANSLGTVQNSLDMFVLFCFSSSLFSNVSALFQLQSGNLSFLTGKHVLVVEDIIETGKTMEKLLSVLDSVKPLSVKVLTLLTKRTDAPAVFKPDFVGFDIPNHFVVGFGFDYNEMFRDMDHICIINDYGKLKYSIKS
ncbi:unnamed protein product [Soboliphyme baturini]|uniref:Pribosyltran domain-containing protein n=1 Tax=Soboliphyme baturini TaxID=241478 RepID=A0A183ILU2_9BILA|nr:unnamed protein product [Soboliphyme baturini]